ncbi:MAG: hypothetical protein RLY86_764 [Pseudomonadota bacterium]|jgi:antitoxin VapB
MRAKVFQSGNSQAVRLPREFRFQADEVEIFRRGDEVVLRERPATLAHIVDLIAELPDMERPEVLMPEDRHGL